MDFHQTWYVHWYWRHLVWDCQWANFVNFWQLSANDTCIFSFPDDNLRKCQWILTKRGMSIDIVKMSFSICNEFYVSNGNLYIFILLQWSLVLVPCGGRRTSPHSADYIFISFGIIGLTVVIWKWSSAHVYDRGRKQCCKLITAYEESQ